VARVVFRKHITPAQIAALSGPAYSFQPRNEIKLGEKVDFDCAVVFFDLCNFTNISFSLPNETVLKILQDVFSYISKNVDKHDGLIDKYPGDGAVAFFPYRKSGDVDETVEYALDCVAEVMYWFYDHCRYWYDLPKESHSLELCAGVDAGKISIAHVGSEIHSELILLGDRVNCASKCQSAAEKKEVVIGQDAADRVRSIYSGYFSTGPNLGVVYTLGNRQYLSKRFDWEKFSESSSWISKE
jgi:class 3 adenylate cyclase